MAIRQSRAGADQPANQRARCTNQPNASWRKRWLRRSRSHYLGCALAFACMSAAGALLPHRAAAQNLTFSNVWPANNSANLDYPYSVAVDASGNLYGICNDYGAGGVDAVYALVNGSLSCLGQLSPSSGPYNPAMSVCAAGGNVWGVALQGGPDYYGGIFSASISGAGITWPAYFDAANGEYAAQGITLGPDGNMYGSTNEGANATIGGVVFQMTPGGAYTVLYTFPWDTTASAYAPWNAPVLASDGNLYGAAAYGLPTGRGAIYQLTPAGAQTPIYTFSSTTPVSARGCVRSFTEGSDGYLYGIDNYGGDYGYGALFRVSKSGALTVIHSFTSSDGIGAPNCPLVLSTDGSIYGVATYGGANGQGAIFRVPPGGAYGEYYTFTGADPWFWPTWLAEAPDGSMYLVGGGNYLWHVTVSSTPVPVLSSISPASADAGGPAFTLLAKGSAFQSNSAVMWNSGPLVTTYISASVLKASVPASLISTPGSASITITTPGAGSSSAKTVKILQTTLKLTGATLTRNPTTGVITATLSVRNAGYLTASSVQVTKSTLASTATSSSLPQSLGSISAGQTLATQLTYPGSAGSTGAVTTLKVSGKFTGGTLSGSVKVTLP